MTEPTRRHFLAGATAFAGICATTGAARARAEILSPLKWAPRNHRVLSNLIAAQPTPGSRNSIRPYAVFDWDNTCIFGDCQETLLHYTLETFSFALSPDRFFDAIRRDVPQGPLGPNFLNAEGQALRFCDLATDMTRDYAALWSRYGTWSPERTAVPRDTPALEALRTRLLYSYNAVNTVAGPKVALYWIIRLLAGMTNAEITKLAASANRWALGRDIGQLTHLTPPDRAGQSGPLRYTAQHGLRLTPEMSDLQHALREAGIEVFVCSASLEAVVRAFATDPDFGYNLPADNILGIRMEEDSGKLGTQPLADWPLTYANGKVDAIRMRLTHERGHGPLLVCGDSSGDVAMQTTFPDTRLSLIINRLSGGGEGALSRKAVQNIDAVSPRILLQGRDENTGEWRPSEETVPFGTTTARLLGSG
ncbi:haloacid dehalogenase-like hydrolase [Gluconobacter albidus]|uniref:haloacid dehalogenase-like hydrolase n=1 Tax=Gluconobacter TaxID=441 RepID=UPI00209CEF79|nr:HAD family hydrolase [Gluconobacter albidus]MCP1274508.1 haloacid dehalogenase-like hydrolase [Gluconobacter albidus]